MNYLNCSVKELYDNYLNLPENKTFFSDFSLSYCLIDQNDTVFICIKEQQIIGILALHPTTNKKYESLMMETHHKFYKNGIAQLLIKKQFEFLKIKKAQLIMPKFSKIGAIAIKKYYLLFAQQHNVNLIKN